MDILVPCSPNNPIPTYVAAAFNSYSPHPQPGYAYYREGKFSCGYFMQGSEQGDFLEDGYYLLMGGNVSFRPHREVPENLRFKVGSTKDYKPIYIGTIYISGEEICGPVIDGVCYVYRHSILSDGENYKVLGLNEGC
ncbi:Hypothetical predicted protein [Cloeon dipterum]|uniref:Uncharacterized protein n=1 Tax=Cloeon dipterum TaxID=197152 RepID=A0A8S1DTE9_9INSE|nr:Hypothetical predicted protein [Cloeon dipterum]